MPRMRAKLRLSSIEVVGPTQEQLVFYAVGSDSGYPADGSDEDNTYAKFTPSASFTLLLANPALIGTFKTGETYYVDFTPASPAA